MCSLRGPGVSTEHDSLSDFSANRNTVWYRSGWNHLNKYKIEISYSWGKPLVLPMKHKAHVSMRTQLCSLPAAPWPSCLTRLLFGLDCMWEHEGRWHWGRDLRHGALASRGLLVGLRHSALCLPSSAPDSLSVWLPRTHLGKAEKSLILYLVQGPLLLMTVDDNPAGNKGISPVTWNGKQWEKVKKQN